MASSARVREGLTREEFLPRPDIDEPPHLQEIDVRIEAMVSPRGGPLGALIHPYHKAIDVNRPGPPPRGLGADEVLEGGPVLPGFRRPGGPG